MVSKTQLDNDFLTGPGEDLIAKLLGQLAKVPGFINLFGPYTPGSDNQRWADYQRFDWSIRALPAINIYESASESKESDNAFLNGTLTIQVYWPPNFRRSDSRRIEAAFKGILENFFASALSQSMLDELYYISRPEKVYGLNEMGRRLSWSPNIEGIIADELVSVTMMNVEYKIDLRAWYRAMEFINRTKENPFAVTLDNLQLINGSYQGSDKDKNIYVDTLENIPVHNP